MKLRRQKSRKTKITDVLTAYLKLQAARKTAKGAKKAAKGTAVYKVAKKTPIVRTIPVIAGAGVAAAIVAKKLRGGGGQTPAAA